MKNDDIKTTDIGRQWFDRMRAQAPTVQTTKTPWDTVSKDHKGRYFARQEYRIRNVDAGYDTKAHREAMRVPHTGEKALVKRENIERLEQARLQEIKGTPRHTELTDILSLYRNSTNDRLTLQTLRARHFSKKAYGKGWREWADTIRHAYKGVCPICGSAGKHVHHIEPAYVQFTHALNACATRAQVELLLTTDARDLHWNRAENLILLCVNCHRYIHDHMGEFNAGGYNATQLLELQNLKDSELEANARRYTHEKEAELTATYDSFFVRVYVNANKNNGVAISKERFYRPR